MNPDVSPAEYLADLEGEVVAAVSRSHGIIPADLVLVRRGAIPITTSGKVRRASCAEQYRDDTFARLVHA